MGLQKRVERFGELVKQLFLGSSPVMAMAGRATLLILLVVVCVAVPGLVFSGSLSRPLPVLPGAQGFGIETPAGRGGVVLKVTNLDDAGDGSLRAALDAVGPRTIVFEVGGSIDLKSDLKIKHPYISVAGQTAPSPGITLKGAGLVILTHDVLVQHLRIRVGEAPEGPEPASREGVRISGRSAEVYNVVCDHLSVSWAIDEVVSTVYGVRDITISNSIISEGLRQSIHPQGVHSKGVLVREGSKNLALVGNLFAHNLDRNPRIVGESSVVLVNNLLYNGGRTHWVELDLGRGKKPQFLSAVGNVFISGPDTPRPSVPIKVQKSCLPGTEVYLLDNMAPGPVLSFQTTFDPQVNAPPAWHWSLVPYPAKSVEAQVLAKAGARPADRDAVDRRVVAETRFRTGSIRDHVDDVEFSTENKRTFRRFTMPNSPNGDDDRDGYTNIEEELHKFAEIVESDID